MVVQVANNNDVFKKFKQSNPHAEIVSNDEYFCIQNPWGAKDAELKIKKDDAVSVDIINSLSFDPKYDAIFHQPKNTFEFIFSYLDPNTGISKDIADRKFSFHFEGNKFTCYFAEPTKEFVCVTKVFQRLPSEEVDVSLPQITPFVDFNRLDKLPEFYASFFKNRVPRNFFIQANVPLKDINVESLFKHVNFLLRYYDRASPLILIKNENDSQTSIKPIRYIEERFPEELVLHPIDDVILKLLEVARNSEHRFAFMYYYQVIEYAAHDYIDDQARNAIRNLLRDPAIVCAGEEKFANFFAQLINMQHSDDVKMKKVMTEYCDPKVLWKEVLNDKFFFSQTHIFQGGFQINPLIAETTDEDSWRAMWMPKLFDHLTKMRNAIVHVRERRENKVILPTSFNNRILASYLPLLARAAEQIAVKTKGCY